MFPSVGECALSGSSAAGHKVPGAADAAPHPGDMTGVGPTASWSGPGECRWPAWGAGSGAVWHRSDRGQNVHRAQSRSLRRVLNRITLHGSIVGTHQDLTEVFQLHRLGRTRVLQERRPLDRVNEAFTEVGTCGRGRPGRPPVSTVPDHLAAPSVSAVSASRRRPREPPAPPDSGDVGAGGGIDNPSL